MAVKLPNPKYIPKKYKEADYPGQKVQIDVKYVPASCLVGAAAEDAKENGGYYYQYTFIDEYSRFRYLEAFKEHNSYSSSEFIKNCVKRFPYAIECVQTDNGPEFTNRLNSQCTDKKTLFEVTLDQLCIQHKCIKPFTLVGGTALSLQIEKRQSEDLDFMKWLKKRNEKPDVNWPSIKKELETIGTISDYDISGFDQVTFNFEGVKLSFYAAPRKEVASMKRIPYLNNLYLADMESIGAMKMEAMLRRAKFRDYYDVYSILMEGGDINKMIVAALEHSDHKLRTRGLFNMLTTGKNFIKEKGFEELMPVYDVSSDDIQKYIKAKLLEVKEK